MSTNDEIDSDFFEKSMNHELLLYYWRLRYLGQDVDSKIEKLEAIIYPEIRRSKNRDALWQRDIDELQLLLAIVDDEENRDRVFVTKAVVHKLEYTKLIMSPDQNHARPHFHIHYKSQHKASYAVDTLELLAGNMPKRYEKPMLYWASRQQDFLLLVWNELKAGRDVRELIVHADEQELQ